MAPNPYHPDRPSDPGEVKRLLLSLRPTISDLFAGYEVPDEQAGRILREVVDRSLDWCHRTEQPRRLFLEMLEDRCAALAEARDQAREHEEAEEETDDDRAPDA